MATEPELLACMTETIWFAVPTARSGGSITYGAVQNTKAYIELKEEEGPEDPGRGRDTTHWLCIPVTMQRSARVWLSQPTTSAQTKGARKPESIEPFNDENGEFSHTEMVV